MFKRFRFFFKTSAKRYSIWLIQLDYIMKKDINKLMSFSQQPKITFITCSKMLGNGKDLETMDYFDQLYCPQASIIIPVLKKMGYNVEIVDWEDQQIKWKEQGLLIMGTVWQYTKKLEKFFNLLEYFQTQNLQIANNTKLIKWNATKKYLNDLKNHNFCIPNTVIFETDSKFGLRQALIQFKQQYPHTKGDVIIKGLADSAGEGYLHLNQENEEQATKHFEMLKKKFRGVVMQNFIPQLNQKSQFSFVFFNGKLSHFYLKVPKAHQDVSSPLFGAKSYCIKKDHSNITEVIQTIRNYFRPDFSLTQQEIKKMRSEIGELYPRLLQMFRQLELDPPLYIRIDCVLMKDRLTIIQLEAVEPYLMLGESMQNDPENNTIQNFIQGVIKPFF